MKPIEIKAKGILSTFERTVVLRIIEGKKRKEIARELEVSPKTVDTYQQRARQKIGGRNTAEMIRIALLGK